MQQVFEDAEINGSAVEFVDREQTVAAIKFGIKVIGGRGPRSGQLSKAVDVVNDWVAKLEAQGPDEKFQLQDLDREAAILALYGNFDQLPPEVREEAARRLSTKFGKNFENDYLKPAREHRVLGETASTSGNELPDDSKPLDTLTYDDGIALVNEQLAIQKEQLDAIQEGNSLKDRKDKLHADADRLRAGVYLTMVALGPIISDREADKIGTIGNSFIKMHEALAKYGPGGITPDKLLMCSNMVGAGMLIAQLFVQQEDPTMVALQSIMKQLKDISEKLDQIDKKIDKLSNLVLVGFERVLQSQRYAQDRINDFSRILLSNIRDTTQRQAILDFARYLTYQSENYKLLLTCSATLRDIRPKVDDCLKELAVDLSRKTIFTEEIRNTTPRIFDPKWSNQMLSFDAPASELDGIALTELSGPIYFLQSPGSYGSVIARNHEAVASFAQQKLGLFKPSTVPNPDILAQKLRIYLAAARQSPKVQRKGVLPLTEEALARVDEVNQFVTATAGDEALLSKSASATGAQLNKLQSVVTTLIDQVMTAPYAELKSRFASAKIGPCGGVPGRPALVAPVGVEKVVENVFWVAQEMGFGQVQACYELNKSELTQTMGVLQFFRLPFEIKTYFQPSPQIDAGHISKFELEGGLITGENGAVLINDKTISSRSTYSTYNNSGLDLFIGSWYGNEHFKSETFACVSKARAKPKPLGSFPSPCNIPVDSVFKRFDAEAIETISSEQRALGR